MKVGGLSPTSFLSSEYIRLSLLHCRPSSSPCSPTVVFLFLPFGVSLLQNGVSYTLSVLIPSPIPATESLAPNTRRNFPHHVSSFRRDRWGIHSLVLAFLWTKKLAKCQTRLCSFSLVDVSAPWGSSNLFWSLPSHSQPPNVGGHGVMPSPGYFALYLIPDDPHVILYPPL